MPKVSVIVPNYNHAPYLRQRINSVLNQTYTDFELILLDDRSTDDSEAILESYRSHSKVSSIVSNTENSGTTFKQWDKGIQLAKGDWIWIAESDDWCEPNMLETLMANVKDQTSLAIVQSVVVNNNSEILWKSETTHLSKSINGKQFVEERMLLDNFGIPNASMCIFRKAYYHQVNKEFTAYKFCGDWLFWIHIALQGNVFISGKYLNYFRKHDKDVSGSAYQNGLQYSEYFKLLENLQQNNIITAEKKREVLKSKFLIFLNDSRLNQEATRQVSAQFKNILGASYNRLKARLQLIRLLKRLFNK